ncbi:MAG TPA: DivIVA domain-containing protein, partial [Anaerovoracaceae bacterium]|nr:DivIVA domain-containing protein [Anaerovoracaceae bacterium]
MITPLDIENKEFTRSKKGYDEEEVDDFLDLIILDYEKLMAENKRLKHQVEELKAQALRTTSPDQSVLETLEAAKNLMNDISASAERRAEVLLKNAKLDADSIERDARESVRRLT